MQDLLRARSLSIPRPNTIQTIGNYSLGKTIGEGTFAKVKMGTHLATGEKVAIKILQKSRITSSGDVKRVKREIQIHKLLKHPSVIQLFQVIETGKYIFLVMEYASGGELFDYIVKRVRLRQEQSCQFFKQILAGIQFLHQNKIVHRDLKPENLLLDQNLNIKIIDFGLSNVYSQGELLKTACGSPCYAPPEMIAGHKYTPLRADIWSLGVVLYALICGYLPFEDPNTKTLYKKILNGDYKCPKWISFEARDLLKKMMDKNPQKRITVSKIKMHPWFNKANSQNFVLEEKIDQESLQQLKQYGIQPEKTRRELTAKKHTNGTAGYFLISKKKQRRKTRQFLNRSMEIKRNTQENCNQKRESVICTGNINQQVNKGQLAQIIRGRNVAISNIKVNIPNQPLLSLRQTPRVALGRNHKQSLPIRLQ